MSAIGPVQIIAAGFGPDARYEGKIIQELERIEESGVLRVLDVLFVRKEDDGGLAALDAQGEELGGIVGALLGFEFEGHESNGAGEPIDADTVGVSRAEILEVGEALEPGSAAGLVLIEHVWARDLRRAIEETGGTILQQGLLSGDALAEVSPELAAMAAAMDEEG